MKRETVGTIAGMMLGVVAWCIWLELSSIDISPVQAFVGLVMSVSVMGLSLRTAAT